SCQQAPNAYRAAAAAIAPHAARVGVDLIALDAHGKGHLHDFHRRVHRIGDAAGDAVDTILVWSRPIPALDGLIRNIRPAGAGIDAAPREDGRGALAAGHHLPRHEVCERAHHHVGDAVGYLVVGIDDRRRKRGVHDTALGGPDLDGAPAAGIGWNEIVRVDRGLEAAIDARGG